MRLPAILFTALMPFLALAQLTESDCGAIKTPGTNNAGFARGGTIWSEDFAGGFPSSWISDDLSGICPWTYSMDGSWGYYNNSGGTVADPAINSTSAANGFLICDPDSANNAVYGQPSGTNYQYLETYFITERIDLSAEPAVLLEFEQAYRFNNSVDMVVAISNNGTSWTDWHVQNDEISNNSHSTDPELVSLNISQVAGNQDTVYIKVGWETRVYYWMIDDMKIVTAPDDDVKLSKAHYDNYIEYFRYPQSQIQQWEFSSFLSNQGMNTQNNVFLDVTIFDASMGSVFNTTSTTATLNMLDTTTAVGLTGFVPGGIDTLTIVYKAEQDESDAVPENDSVASTIMITDSVYARDNDDYIVEFWGDTNSTGTPKEFEIGNIFEIVANDATNTISVYVGPGTDVGAPLYGAIYEVVDAGTAQFTLLRETPTHYVGIGEVDGWVTLQFTNPVLLTGGTAYLIMAGHEQSDSALYVGLASNTSPAFTVFVRDGSSWLYSVQSPMVRLNLNNLLSTGDNVPSIEGNLYPNPANDQVVVDFDEPLDWAQYQLITTDGRQMRWGTFTNQQRVLINTEDLPVGLYIFRLVSEDGFYSQKVNVVH